MGVKVTVLDIDDLPALSREMERISVSPAGIRIMAPKGVFRIIRIEEVPLKAAILIKQEMLAKGGEAAVSREVAGLSVESTGIILMGTLRQYDSVLASLRHQPFGLDEVAREVGLALKRFASYRRVDLVCGRHTLHIGKRTYIMGIINTTPDSFSDGGKYMDPDVAIAHGKKLVEEGADILDIGGESTRPGADPVTSEEELARTIPVIRRLAQEVDVPLSIDTYKAEVARQAIQAGASIINDISALRMDPNMGHVAAEYDVPVVLMHMQGEPRTMQRDPQYRCVVSEIISFFRDAEERAAGYGIRRDRIIFDPGIGFGKLMEHNLEILRRLREFSVLGRPVLVGTSRKSFIASIAGHSMDARDDGTAATVALSVAGGADIVRVHDVRKALCAARMADAITRSHDMDAIIRKEKRDE